MVDHATQAKAESFVKSQHDRARRMAERLFDIWVVTDLGMGSVMARPTISPDATPQKVVVLVGVRCLLGDEIIVMRIGGRLYTPGSIRSRVRIEDVHVSGVESVNGLTGEVLIDADDISDTSTSHKFVTSGDLANLANLSGTNTGDQDLSGYALSSSLSLVATSGDYNDLDNLPSLFDGDYDSLTNKPTLGTAAAANTGDFATAAQGSAADSAVQPADLADVATSGDYDDLDNLPMIPAQFNPIAGTNVSLSGTYPNITFNAAGGGGGAVDSVNGQTGVVVLDADDIDDASTSHKFVTASDITKLANTSGTNTGDQVLPDALTDLDTTVTGSQLNGMKSKLDGIQTGAEVNVQSDWNAVSGDAFIQNKPSVYTQSEVDSMLNEARPKSNSTSAAGTVAVGSAGDYVMPGSAITLSGLNTSKTYVCVCSISVVVEAGGSGESMSIGMRLSGSGSDTTTVTTAFEVVAPKAQHTYTYTINKVPNGSGEITLTPIVRWGAGSYSFRWASSTLTVF